MTFCFCRFPPLGLWISSREFNQRSVDRKSNALPQSHCYGLQSCDRETGKPYGNGENWFEHEIWVCWLPWVVGVCRVDSVNDEICV